MNKLNTQPYEPSNQERHKMAEKRDGYLELQHDIEMGKLTSVKEIVSWLDKTSQLLNETIKADVWIPSKDGLSIDLDETVRQANEDRKILKELFNK